MLIVTRLEEGFIFELDRADRHRRATLRTAVLGGAELATRGPVPDRWGVGGWAQQR